MVSYKHPCIIKILKHDINWKLNKNRKIDLRIIYRDDNYQSNTEDLHEFLIVEPQEDYLGPDNSSGRILEVESATIQSVFGW